VSASETGCVSREKDDRGGCGSYYHPSNLINRVEATGLELEWGGSEKKGEKSITKQAEVSFRGAQTLTKGWGKGIGAHINPAGGFSWERIQGGKGKRSNPK